MGIDVGYRSKVRLVCKDAGVSERKDQIFGAKFLFHRRKIKLQAALLASLRVTRTKALHQVLSLSLWQIYKVEACRRLC
jgi:hypothetical protein